MYATEFKTVIHDPYVKIPEFERFKDRAVRIIILEERPEEPNVDDFIDKITAAPKHVEPGTTFMTREDANAR